MSVRPGAIVALLLLGAAPRPCAAQRPTGPGPGITTGGAPGRPPEPAPARAPRRLELRADYTAARASRLEGSAGVVLPVGTYVRVALSGGAGTGEERGSRFTAWRGDATVRFQLDPFHQAKAGVYGAAGIAWLDGDGRAGTARLTLGAGLELPEWGPVAPALELGVGGGARIAIALRTAARRWR